MKYNYKPQFIKLFFKDTLIKEHDFVLSQGTLFQFTRVFFE